MAGHPKTRFFSTLLIAEKDRHKKGQINVTELPHVSALVQKSF